jgi:hypothetical protein
MRSHQTHQVNLIRGVFRGGGIRTHHRRTQLEVRKHPRKAIVGFARLAGSEGSAPRMLIENLKNLRSY